MADGEESLMTNPVIEQTGVKKLVLNRRKSVSVSQTELVKFERLFPDHSLPLVARPALKGVDLLSWAASEQGLIKTHLTKHGAILFRDFDVATDASFEQFIKAVSSELLEYRERSSPRSRVSGNVYTSTDHPADQRIFLHNENSYQQTWPLKIFFYCETPPTEGGETPIADCRRVFARIDPKIVERFVEKKVMYVRNFGDGFGLPWETVYQTDDKGVVEQQCRRAGVEAEWKEGNRLRTRAVREVLALHPQTREVLWFNHATFFHVTTLERATREALLSEFKEEDLPTNTFYGDGSSIEPSVMDELRECYLSESVAFPWQERDILMLDNMLVAHGRAPFAGARKILAGMAEAYSDRGV
jgi:alpha-ketoglutarate-dependent taurine dioxygenase